LAIFFIVSTASSGGILETFGLKSLSMRLWDRVGCPASVGWQNFIKTYVALGYFLLATSLDDPEGSPSVKIFKCMSSCDFQSCLQDYQDLKRHPQTWFGIEFLRYHINI
jgi:hypothetical protein